MLCPVDDEGVGVDRAGGELRAALAWLTHPVSVVALVVLLLNDHVLKSAYGTWWTGKLSDVAGLVLAPALLAVAIAAVRACRAPRPVPAHPGVLATVVVGAGFAVVKATGVGAALASAVWTAAAGPSVVLRDPTDLLALPALGVAWWVARASASPRRVRAARAWPLVLPLAVLATAATSSMGPVGTMTVEARDGAVFVGTGWSRTELTELHSTDGTTWTRLDASDAPTPTGSAAPSPTAGAEPSSAASSGPTDDMIRCVPAEPSTCFRPAVDAVGVDRSDDGGRTWRADWALTDEQVRALDERWEDPARLATREVAVLPTVAGFRVYAASGGDGLAVRHEDGRWERLGMTYRGGSAVALPGERQALTYPVPLEGFVGLLGGLLALAVVAHRTRATGGPSRRAGALAAGVVAAALAGVAVVVEASSGSYVDSSARLTLTRVLLVVLLGAAAVLTLVSVALAGRALRWGVLTGVAVGVAAGVATSVGWSDAGRVGAGVVVALVGTTIGALLVRRVPDRGGSGPGGRADDHADLPPYPPAAWDRPGEPTH